MSTPEGSRGLSEALSALQAALPLTLERDSQGTGYRYTSLDALVKATRPILNAHGFAITQAPAFKEVDGKLRPVLVTDLGHAKGSLHCETPLYVNDQNMQGLGAAITYARRYAWASILGIASEEDTDGATLPASDEDVPF